MAKKHRQTKACEFPAKVRMAIYNRDCGCCVLCGSPNGQPNAHFIPRSAGGLGIEENGLTLCFDCHYAFDHTPQRAELRQYLKAYLQECYPDWNEDALRYRKYACFDE